MKKLITLVCLSILAGCNSNKDSKVESMSPTSSNDSANITYPVTATYSPSWEMGDPKHAIMILHLYNAWDAGNLDVFAPTFADSIELFWASGDIMKGTRDSILATVKAYRNQYSAIKNTVHGFLSMRHKDTKEEWVLVWTKEVSTSKTGKIDSIELQENWRINKAGQTDLAYQYDRNIKPPKQ